MKELLGYSDDELDVNFDTFTLHMHPDERELRMIAIEAHLKDRVPFNVEGRLRTKSGEYRWFLTRGEAVWDEAGNPIRMVGSTTDITERKLAEDAVSEERDRAQRYLDVAGVIIIAIDADQKVAMINKKGCEVLKYKENDIIGKDWPDNFIPERIREEVKNVLTKFMAGEIELVEYYENPVLTKNGEERIISWHNSILRDIEGKITGTLSSGEDITEQKHLEKQLIQSQKMEAVGTLAGGVAHDFNNLLTVVIGYSDILLMKLDKKDQMYKLIEAIRKAGQRAASVAQQLLAFSRKQPLQKKVLELNTVMKKMEEMLRHLIGEDIELITEFEPAPGYMEADEGQVEQVLMNLVVNARDAMPEGGKLTIRTENVNIDEYYCKIYSYARPGKFVCISVEDTGVGMDKDTISHIFDPFFTTKEEGKGTGLGLSVIYGILKQHEGWINVYSETGKGTVFKCYLPASFVSEEEEAEEEISLKGLQGHGERVLLVEDEEMLRGFAAGTLRENGYVVFEAEAAEEALDLFEKEKREFHIVFSDVVLPDINGIRLVEQLLSQKPELKVLLCSGYLDNKSRWPIVQERGFNFLQKPFTLYGLLQAFKKAIKQH